MITPRSMFYFLIFTFFFIHILSGQPLLDGSSEDGRLLEGWIRSHGDLVTLHESAHIEIVGDAGWGLVASKPIKHVRIPSRIS